jgi:predicted ATPase/DNA-binding winged helix-turn-helix (wHTH) protein/Flp pilus assembly protein TadD
LESRHTAYRFGEFTLDLARGALFRSGEEVKLRPKVFEVLKYLVENSGRLIGKEEMAKAIWPDCFVTDDSLVQCTVELRRALGDPDQQMIKTIPRRGYLFAAAVHPSNGPAAFPESVRELSTAQDGRVAVEKLSSRRFDVPVPRTSLVGREKDVTEAVRLLLDPDIKLLSFTGTGGAGKTRLALAVAKHVAEHFPGGVQFVALASITNPDLVGAAIVKALNLQPVANRTIAQVISDQMAAGGPFLLILDNFEQVLPAAQLVSEILVHCPFIKVVVTTRASLQIYGEQEFPVAPLLGNAAMQLFEQRATGVRPNFAVTSENEAAIQAICNRLDGLPLAIELAAARTKILSPKAILERLQSRLDLLTKGASDLPERQRTLRRTIDWSYDLLNVAEQRLFWRFSAFVGGATLEATEAVCNTGQDLEIGVFEGLGSLLDKNLVQRVDSPDAEPRFTMLETIREYALERLASSSEESQTRRSHAAYCLVIAEEGNPELDSKERSEWLARCDLEIDNCRSALDWLAQNNQVEWALRLSMALFRFWDMRDLFVEGRTRLETLLRLVQSGYLKERGRICTFLGALATSQGDYAVADTFLRQSLTFYRELNDHWGIAASWNALAIAARDPGDFERAEHYFEQSLEYWRRLPDRLSTARCLHNLANAAKMRGDYERAATALAEAASIFVQVGDASGAAWSINQSGDLALEEGRIEAALDLYRNALAAFRNTGDRWGCARSLTDLGWIYSMQGEFAAAHAAYREALELFVELGYRRGIARALEGSACLAAASGDTCRALTLAAAAEHLRSQIGAPLHQAERAKLEERLSAAREILNSRAGEGAWQKGLEMPLQAAILLAFEQSSLPS